MYLSIRPDFSNFISSPGKQANNANGNAKAMENPKKTYNWPYPLLLLLMSTNRFRDERSSATKKDTSNLTFNAIKNIPEKLLILAF